MSINHELDQTNLIKRTALIIYLKSASDQYKLRHYGDIVYFSKKMRYCIVYVNRNEVKTIRDHISRLDFVIKVEISEADKLDFSSKHIEEQITEMAAEAEKKLQLEQKRNENQLQ